MLSISFNLPTVIKSNKITNKNLTYQGIKVGKITSIKNKDGRTEVQAELYNKYSHLIYNIVNDVSVTFSGDCYES